MRFVIWGCGYRGKIFADMIGKKYIYAFIDKNYELQNKQYQGIPIWSYETYKEKHLNYPIVVSVNADGSEIMKQLCLDGIAGAFSLEKDWFKVTRFLRQIPLETIIREYDLNKPLYIYGCNLLGILIYLKLHEHGYSCRMIIQYNASNEVRLYIENNEYILTAEMEEVKKGSHILFAMPMQDMDMMKCDDVILERYYDVKFRTELYYNPALEKFKDKHLGEKCFVIATGPSLRFDDLERLRQEKIVCFSVNGIFKGFGQTKWRPNYYMLGDPAGTIIWHDDLLSLDVKEKFIADIAWNYTKDEEQDNMNKWHIEWDLETGSNPEFSADFARVSYLGHTIIYEGVLQLAVYMGFKEIYLLGADCCNYQDPKKKHFISNYDSRESASLDINNIILAYQAAKDYADAHGIKIYNATRGGALEIFERVDFDSLFNN